MMKRFLILLPLSLTACESDETKLERLQLAEAKACMPVLVADSAERAYAEILARIQEGASGGRPYGTGSSAIALAESDLEAAKRREAELQAELREVKTNPKAYAEKQRRKAKQKAACDLATRDLNRFMR